MSICVSNEKSVAVMATSFIIGRGDLANSAQVNVI